MADRTVADSAVPDRARTSHTIPANRYVSFCSLAILGCAADLITKEVMFRWRGLPGAKPIWWLWEPYVGIETAVNIGAVFGVLPGKGWLFALLSIAAAVGIIYGLFVRGAAVEWLLTISLGGIMGGILGNLYDRLGMWYQPGLDPAWRNGVRDWILFRYDVYTWPNFNIADSLLVCGAGMLMWHTIKNPAPVENKG